MKQNIRIVIIEDEKPAAIRLQKMLETLLSGVKPQAILGSIQASVEWFSKNVSPDLVFCDIQLADGIAFEIFEQVDVSVPVIFTTAYDQYAIRAFKVNAVDYLLKPIDPDELQQAIQKYQSRQMPAASGLNYLRQWLQQTDKLYKSRFLVKSGEVIKSVQTKEIAFFYSHDKLTFMQSREGKRFVLDHTLAEIENMVDPELFFRLNRKYIASMEAIETIFACSESRLKVKIAQCDDEDIMVSRANATAFRQWLDGGPGG